MEKSEADESIDQSYKESNVDKIEAYKQSESDVYTDNQSQLATVNNSSGHFQINTNIHQSQTLPRITSSSSTGHLSSCTYGENIKPTKKGGDTTSLSSSSSSNKPNISITKQFGKMDNINIDLVNDEGEHDAVEIDIADSEKIKDENKYFSNARRQSISDRIDRRRNSELAAEIIRLSAEHRKKEFFELLTEHEEIVKGIEVWKSTGVFPMSSISKSNQESIVGDSDDDIIEEEPTGYRRQPNSYLTSSVDSSGAHLSHSQ